MLHLIYRSAPYIWITEADDLFPDLLFLETNITDASYIAPGTLGLKMAYLA
jgi:hypothetical protein